MTDRGLPGNIVKILIDWYGKVSNIVKWNNCFSRCVIVKSGICQGGILSPLLFNIYTDCLILGLKSSYMRGLFVGCIAYADDLLLLYGSVALLQKNAKHVF